MNNLENYIMNQPVKKLVKDRVRATINDQTRLYKQLYDLIMQAFHACMARDVVKDYRYKRASKTESYNTINSFSHVALENYALLQLWKLFDKKSSLNVASVVEYFPHEALKNWFNRKIKKLEKDINYISAWRGNFIGHRSEIAQFAPEQFEKKFEGFRGSEERIKSFLLNLLCQIKFEMHRIETRKTMEELTLSLKGFAEFLQEDKDKVLKKYE